MKKTILLTTFMLLIGCSIAKAVNVTGAISANTTWTTANSPYIVTGGIIVNPGVTLTIESGVIVKFNANLGMVVNGTLNARKAQFTSNVTPLAKGAWNNIQAATLSSVVTLDTCNVDYGGSSNQGAIYANLGTVNLTGTIITNSSSSGLYLNTSVVNLKNSSISGCDYAITYNNSGNIVNNGGNTLSGNKYDAANINFTTVASNWRLPTLAIPYVVSQNLNVNASITMQVDSGAIMKFNSGMGIAVAGTLKARKAQFTSNVTPLAKGAWNQIQSSALTGIITLDTCKIEYGGGGNNGSVYVNLGSIAVNNTSITNSSTAGLELYKGTLNLKNSTITLCDWPITYSNNAVLHNNGGNSFTGNKRDAAYIYFSTLTGGWNLEQLPIPYVFYYDFTIAAAGNLSIASGNAFKSANKIYVDGILSAVANKNESIIFTSANNDNIGGDTNIDGAASLPARGSWGGIHFRNTSVDASCILKRCSITYAGSNSGGIIIENANTTVDSCSMANNYFGAEIIGASKPIFTNNTMASSYVVPIAMSFDSEPVFLNNSFSFSDNQYDAIGLLGGTMTANAHLIQRDVTGIPNITYLMLGELIIPQTYTLTIDSGIVIKSNYYGIVVKGALIANGKAGANQVVFTSVKDDNVGNPSDTNKDGTQTNPIRTDWTGLIFEETSDDAKCLLNYTQVKYATMQSKYYYSQWMNGGAVTLLNASPTISNSIVKDVTYGLYAFQASNPMVSKTEFTNALYTPIAFSVSANPTLTDITFVNNAWTALGIIGEKVGINGTIAKRNVAGFNNISYVLLSDLTINSGTNVTVNPGVVIKMQQDILVNGGFKAEGLVNDSITFTSINDDNYGTPKDTRNDGNALAPAKGNWGTIQFNATTDDAFSTFNYVRLFYGSSSSSKGILTFTDAGNTIKNATFSDAGNYGIRIEGSSTPDLTNNVIIRNCQYDPIAMSLTSNPKFNFTSPLFNFLGNGSNGIRIIEGNLSTNATLVKRDVGQIYNVAYIVENLTIMPNTTFTIGEGVVIKFPNTNYYWQNNGINVNGALVAVGTVKSPIVFTSVKDDSKGGDTNGDGNTSVPDKGNWGAVIFRSSNLDNSNLIRNCVFNYGGYETSYDGQYNGYGNIRVFNAKLTVDSCKIEHSSTSAVGVYGSATPIVKNNEMNNIAKTPITMSLFASPTFSNNTISNIGINAIGVAPENYAIDATVPKINFAGFSNMTYYMYGTSKVNSGTQITIPKGITFKSNGQTILDVLGKLMVEGTQLEPVVFTNLKSDTYGIPLDTENDGSTVVPSKYGYAITFQDVSDDLSALNYTIFDYFDEGIRLLQASPTIQNCVFKNSNWGVVLNGVSNPVINNNAFDDLRYTPINISLVSFPSSSVGNTISGSTYKAIGVLSEELVQDATLLKRNFGGIDNIPYFFTGNYTIGTSVTLTVKPGVVSKFADNAKLNVKRGLIAIGAPTADSTIVFTSIKDDFYGGDTNADSTATSAIQGQYFTGWGGINFEDVALDNLCNLDHTIVKFAGNYGSYSAISMTAASPTISNSLFKQNTNGIEIKGSSNPKINYCDFLDINNFAVNNVNQAFIIDATNCWWGDNSGPTHASNIGGKGGKISDKVMYSPWKTSGAGNPLTGDVSLNGSIQAYDASLVLQHVVSLVTLNSLQKKVADVSGDGTITSFDASLILQNVAGITSTFPSEMKSPAIKNEVILSFGNEINSGDKLFSIPVLIENGNRSMAFDIATTFDANLIEPISVTAGKDAKNKLFVFNIDKTFGKVLIGIAGTENLNSQAEVANITFRILDNTAFNAVTNLGIDQFKANETDYTLSSVSKVIEISKTVSGIDYLSAKNAKFSVYPNPIKSDSKIHFNVDRDRTQISIALFDLAGKQIDILLNGIQSVGSYTLNLNKMNRGVYILKMVSGSDTQFQKIIVE